MLDLRLPYFYNLPIAVLLIVHVFYRLDTVLMTLNQPQLFYGMTGFSLTSNPLLLYLKAALMVIPAIIAAAYFFKQYQARNDVYLREAIYILAIVNFLGYFLPGFIS